MNTDKLTPEERRERIAKNQGKVELIDHLSDFHCPCEMPSFTKDYLKRLRYEFKSNIDELNGAL